MIARTTARPRTTTEARFWAKVFLSPDCWLWTGGTTGGYGRFWDGEKVVLATRWLYERVYGPLEGLQVAHRCDVPTCVRPTHLFAATAGENIADMLAKQRNSPPPVHRGQGHHFAVLTDEQVAEMRATYTGRFGEKKELAQAYGISQTTVGRILSGARR